RTGSRKAREGRTCGAPRRSQRSKTSSAVAGSGIASRSSTVTSWPSRARKSAAESPATLPPTTAIRTPAPRSPFLADLLRLLEVAGLHLDRAVRDREVVAQLVLRGVSPARL